MKKLGIVNEETWRFFEHVHRALAKCYDITVFQRRNTRSPVAYDRINRYYLRRDLQSLMDSNDVVFFEWASKLLVFASHLEKASGIVTRLHRYEMYKWVDLVNWDNVDKVILVSEAMRRKFEARFPAHAHKTVVITESIPMKQFHYSPRRSAAHIGILCHLTPRKRVYDLILTFAELCHEGEDLYLHIAGGAHHAHEAYHEAMLHVVRSLGLDQRVTFYGNLEDPWNWYPKIDIFVSNSYSEGLQVAPMEAMASGCYCLAHHWDGAEELLPEENLYFTGSELKQLVRRHMQRSEQERVELSRMMRESVSEKFDVQSTITCVKGVIEEVSSEMSRS